MSHWDKRKLLGSSQSLTHSAEPTIFPIKAQTHKGKAAVMAANAGHTPPNPPPMNKTFAQTVGPSLTRGLPSSDGWKCLRRARGGGESRRSPLSVPSQLNQHPHPPPTVTYGLPPMVQQQGSLIIGSTAAQSEQRSFFSYLVRDSRTAALKFQ